MRRSGLVKKLWASRTLQRLWCLFFVCNTVVLTVCFGCLSFLMQNGFYKDNGEERQRQITQNLLTRDSDDAILYFHLFSHLYLSQESLVGQNFQSPETKEKLNRHLVEYIDKFSEENTNYFFLISVDGETVFKNYSADESRLHYYVNSKDFLNRLTNRYMLDDRYDVDTLAFEAHIRKDLTAHDDYWRVDLFFRIARIAKYAVLVLLPIVLALQVYAAYGIFRFSGRRGGTKKTVLTGIDRVPMYVLLFIYIPLAAELVLLMRRRGSDALCAMFVQLASWFDGHGEAAQFMPAWSEARVGIYGAAAVFLLSAIVLAVLLETFCATFSVRLKKPSWRHQSLLYRALYMRSFDGLWVFLTVLLGIEIAASVWMIVRSAGPHRILWCDAACTAVLLLLVFIVGKDVSVWLTGTHRIARREGSYIRTDVLSGETRSYAEKINFLSRSANAEMEKRYINESFSTQLINGITDGLRIPLSAVAQYVEKLESGTLSPQQEMHCIDEINDISRDLKKTIEDMIRISKATTSNLETSPVLTDAGMMLDMIGGEYAGLFDEKGMQLVTEHPQQTAVFPADGQCMGYIFDGILDLFLQKSVPGTRVFLRANYTSEQVILSLRGYVRPSSMDGAQAFTSDGGMGLPTAKVFTELQKGSFRCTCTQDILQIVLRFPRSDVLTP